MFTETPPPAALTAAQQLDTIYYHRLWQQLFNRGQIPLAVPPDEILYRQDLGRSLRVAVDWLGNLHGQRVLELGCGPGDYTIMLTRRGASVTAIDLAPAALWLTRRRAAYNGVGHAVHTARMAAETLAFPAHTFDWVVGFGLLHHANPTALAPAIHRVLKPGGRALFREPLGVNPVLSLARKIVPYRRKHHSQNEHPLTYHTIRQVGRYFNATRCREFYLFSMITRAVGAETSFPALWHLDEWLLRRYPCARRWCRYVLIEYAT